VNLPDLTVRYLAVGKLKTNPQNPRTHTKHQIRKIAKSIKEFGFVNPVLIERDSIVIAGHGRLAAAKMLGISSIPTITLEDLSPDQVRAYVVADNRLAEIAGWDSSILAIELQNLLNIEDFDVSLTGFEVPEIDLIIQETSTEISQERELVELTAGRAASRPGDLWTVGKHKVICGNALEESTFVALMGRRKADIVITDPPYNVPVEGNVCGKGAIHHREFPMASGEMKSNEFVKFLITSLGFLARFSNSGAVVFVCMDWRHMGELLEAGQQVLTELLNVCVWVKNNGGMGSFYRSRHELIFVFKNGKGRHRNNIQLGQYGRNRTNVWEYPGVNMVSRNREEGNLLALHPTVKPVAMLADALLDCSSRGDVVLDAFLGSGSTLLAAERVGRRCYGIEIDPLYVDVAVRRWQSLTGEHAIHQSGKSFDDLTESRTHLAESRPNNDI